MLPSGQTIPNNKAAFHKYVDDMQIFISLTLGDCWIFVQLNSTNQRMKLNSLQLITDKAELSWEPRKTDRMSAFTLTPCLS